MIAKIELYIEDVITKDSDDATIILLNILKSIY